MVLVVTLSYHIHSLGGIYSLVRSLGAPQLFWLHSPAGSTSFSFFRHFYPFKNVPTQNP